MRVLEGLQPAAALGFFETLCAIPHGSRDTKAISDYCVRFAQERGLSWQQDASNNVIIRKPASPGYEDHPTVILQGHLDMVCEKDADCDIDFSKDCACAMTTPIFLPTARRSAATTASPWPMRWRCWTQAS